MIQNQTPNPECEFRVWGLIIIIKNLLISNAYIIQEWQFIVNTAMTENWRLGHTVKPVCNGHPWDPEIVAIVHRWPLFRGFQIKIAINFDLAGLKLAIVGRWPLFKGGR